MGPFPTAACSCRWRGPVTEVIVVLIILLVIGGAVILAVFLVKKRSGNTRSDDGDEKGERICPSCGGKMTFSEDFNRYRCIDCGKYG